MKRSVILFICSWYIINGVFAYDFSAVASSGQTLYYDIDAYGNVSVTYPNHGGTSYYSGYETPEGNLVIPDSVSFDGLTYRVSSIGGHAFFGCDGLTSVVIPNTITTIGYYAFGSCNHLTNVTIGTGVLYIEKHALDPDQLRRITSKAINPPTIVDRSLHSLAIIIVPCGAYTAYKTTAYWQQHAIYEDLLLDFSASTSDPTRGIVTINIEPTCDNREAQVQANAYHGYHFDHWSDGNTDNPRYIVVLQDTHLVAYFASDNGDDEGIEETAEEGVKLYQSNGQIVVEGAEGNRVTVYDVFGRMLATKRDEGGLLRFDVPATGTYLIRVGDSPARRVVVVR